MAKKETTNGSGDTEHRLDVINEIIQNGFKARLEHDNSLAALNERHIKPVKDLKKQDWDKLAADTGMSKKRLRNLYNVFLDQEQAKTMEDEDRDRIIDDYRMGFNALVEGEMLDFVDVLKADEYVPPQIAAAADEQAAEEAAAEKPH